VGLDVASYDESYRLSLENPSLFWGEAATSIDWIDPPKRILDATDPTSPRWFADGRLNTCFNALDRHVAQGRGDQAALVHDSPVTGSIRVLTYGQLLDLTQRAAGALQSLGVQRGDRVLIYMPTIPEAAVAMLASARLGAIHCVVFGGFGPTELAQRIVSVQPKIIVSASCGFHGTHLVEHKSVIDRAIELSGHTPERCIVVQRPELKAPLDSRDLAWLDVVDAAPPAECIALDATDPLYILYTSGTTGTPKGVVRDNGGHAVAVRWSMTNVYGVGPGDVFWAASDIGWAVGHARIVYGPLLTGCTSIMYEGKPVGTPDAGAFGRVIADHRVEVLVAVPSMFRTIRQDDPSGRLLRSHDMGTLRHMFLSGERLDRDTHDWVGQVLGVPVIDYWGQTETGWSIAANPVGLDPRPPKVGSVSVPLPGFDLRVVADDGRFADPGSLGKLVVKLPLPPGGLSTLWRDQERLLEIHFAEVPGYYLTGDEGFLDSDGYVFLTGRSDDVINVGGRRVSPGAIEDVINEHPAVAESVVVGIDDAVLGQVPYAFVVMVEGATVHAPRLEEELIRRVRDSIGRFTGLRGVRVVEALPKTTSGKVSRRLVRELAASIPALT
jgi:propionyl-CoA synthetase